MKLGDVKNFDLLEKCAEDTERKKQMKNVKLSDNEIELISQWITDCKGGLKSAKKLTGFSVNYLSALKNKHKDTVRGSTYEIFATILNPVLSPNAEAEAENVKNSQDEKSIDTNNEFEVMALVDSLLSKLKDDETRMRALSYFKSKYDKESIKL